MTSNIPERTPEQRHAALVLALETRRARAEVKARVADGTLAFADVLEEGRYGAGDEAGDHKRVVGRIEVGELLLAVPRIGPVHAAEILVAAGEIPFDQRLDTLNAEQRGALVTELASSRP